MNPRDLSFYSSCPKTNDTNGNDYETMLKIMLKLCCPTVTVHKGDEKHIISFGAHHTTSYIFDSDNLMDVTQTKISFEEWVQVTFLLTRRDGAIITIYNR